MRVIPRASAVPVLALLVLAGAVPVLAYTIYLTDGSKLTADEPYTVEDGKAIIILPNGTRTSIDVAEIDVERTRQANVDDYGAALVIDDKYTEIPSEEPPPDRQSLSDLIARDPGAASREPSRQPPPPDEATPARRADGTDLLQLPRSPFHHADLAAEVQRMFHAQGVGNVLVSQGSQRDRLLIDITADSEATVFRGIEVAARALVHARDSFPDQRVAFELLLMTSDREPAGEFVMGEEQAQRLAAGEIETSTFYIENVRW